MPYRRRGIGDLIPTSGEGRALVEVKGRVGGKGARMRRSFRNSNYKYRRERDRYKWSRPLPTNVNWHYELAEGAWGIWGQPGDAYTGFNPTRIFTINVEDESGDAANGSMFVKRVILDLGVHCAITKYMGASGRLDFDRAARDDLPAPGVFINTTPNGTLLDGDYGTDGRISPQSWIEGYTICWALMYEDSKQASSIFAFGEGGYFDPNLPEFYEKNDVIFARGTTQVSAYRPGRIRVNKSFTGRGVQLLPGYRKVNQITFAMWGWAPGGTTIKSGIGIVPADARYQYLDND